MTESYDVVVIGSGPAGLSAAVYTSRAGLSTAIVTGQDVGGLLTTTDQIDNYLGMFGSKGQDMADTFIEHAQKFGAVLKASQTVTGITKAGGLFTVTTDFDETFTAKSVVYAAGSTPKKLGVSGEDLSGVSYCATCDGIFYEGDDLVVVGGGETAVEDSLYLSGIANSVTVLVRKDWRATQPAVEKLEAQQNVTIRKNVEIAEILGDGGVESLRLKNNIDGSEEEFKTDGVFVAVGQTPQSHIAHAANMVTIFENGFIQSSDVDGFFDAGDVSNPDYRQVAVAVGTGAVAGIDATNFVIRNS